MSLKRGHKRRPAQAGRKRKRRSTGTRSKEERVAEQLPSWSSTGWELGRSHPVLRFVLVFGVLLLAGNLLMIAPLHDRMVVIRFLELNASVAGAVLRLLGEAPQVAGQTVSGEVGSITVGHGCDAAQPIVILVSAVIATPAAWRKRAVGVVVGVGVLVAMNMIRIVSLYYVSAWRPDWFHIIHVDVWGALFIILAVTLWIGWANRALPSAVLEVGDDDPRSKSD